MITVSRVDARARGLKRYFTGKPCKRGHISERLVSIRKCCVCNTLAGVAWTALHPAKIALANKYSNMKRRVEGRVGGPRGAYFARLYMGLGLMPKAEFMTWALHDPEFKRLWREYQLSGWDLRLAPSIDRIDTQRGYVAGNIQFITHADNARKSCLWRHHGINQITKEAA